MTSSVAFAGILDVLVMTHVDSYGDATRLDNVIFYVSGSLDYNVTYSGTTTWNGVNNYTQVSAQKYTIVNIDGASSEYIPVGSPEKSDVVARTVTYSNSVSTNTYQLTRNGFIVSDKQVLSKLC